MQIPSVWRLVSADAALMRIRVQRLSAAKTTSIFRAGLVAEVNASWPADIGHPCEKSTYPSDTESI